MKKNNQTLEQIVQRSYQISFCGDFQILICQAIWLQVQSDPGSEWVFGPDDLQRFFFQTKFQYNSMKLSDERSGHWWISEKIRKLSVIL